MVEVDEEHADRVVTAAPADHRTELVHEPAAIEQTGQGVDPRLVAQRRLDELVLGHVAGDERERPEHVALVPDGRDGERQLDAQVVVGRAERRLAAPRAGTPGHGEPDVPYEHAGRGRLDEVDMGGLVGAEQCSGRGVGVQHAARGVEQHDHVGGGLYRGHQDVGAVAKRLLARKVPEAHDDAADARVVGQVGGGGLHGQRPAGRQHPELDGLLGVRLLEQLGEGLGHGRKVVGVDVLDRRGSHLTVARPGHDRARRGVGVGELHLAIEHDDGVGDTVQEPSCQVVREGARRGRRHPGTVCAHVR